jgi:hypothetical protein
MTRLTITVELSKTAGLFVGRDELAEVIRDAVQDVDLSGLGSQGDSEYQVDDVTVEAAAPRPRRKRRAITRPTRGNPPAVLLPAMAELDRQDGRP